MDELSDGLLAEVGQVYLVANTPRYLYKRLLDTQLYDHLSDWQPEQLLDLFKEAVDAESPDTENYGVAYCALIALVKNLKSGVAVEIPADELKWLADIIDIAESERESSTELDITSSKRPTRQWKAGPSGTTTSDHIEAGVHSSSIIIER